MLNLRQLAMRGGAYMSLRQGFGVLVSFGGIILLTRLIGPGGYGLYAVALGIFNFALTVCLWGVEVYLVRREGEEREEVYHQAFTLLLLLGCSGTLLALAALPLLQGWVRIDGFQAVGMFMFLSLPIALLTKVPLARLERALDYRWVAISELSGLMVFYVVALSFAYLGSGAIAPVIGWWAQQGLLLALLYPAARYRPRLYWSTALVREMVGYGLSFSASIWVWQLRELVNPLIVGRYLGAEAAGYVALALRFVKGLSFVKEAMWRISIAALAKVREDKPRLAWAVGEGMKLQVVGQAPLLVAFGWVAVWALPLVYGDDWSPVMQIYPFIALGFLANATFNLHASALYVLQRNFDVVVFHLAHIALFAGSALVLVPRVGLIGYGLAEVAALASYAVVHAFFVRAIGRPSYRMTAVWVLTAALALFVHELGWWAASGVVLVLLWPRTWRELEGYAKSMWKVREAR